MKFAVSTNTMLVQNISPVFIFKKSKWELHGRGLGDLIVIHRLKPHTRPQNFKVKEHTPHVY